MAKTRKKTADVFAAREHIEQRINALRTKLEIELADAPKHGTRYRVENVRSQIDQTLNVLRCLDLLSEEV